MSPTISLSGASSTKALPAGPAVRQIATVTTNGSAVAGKSVSITVSGSGSGSGSGTTDSAGRFTFIYVPPSHATTATLTATCSDCSNTATKTIDVSGSPEPQMCPRDAGSTFGNPVIPTAAAKAQTETDWQDQGPHPLNVIRNYRSDGNLPPVSIGNSPWTHNYAAATWGDVVERTVRLGDGSQTTFLRVNAGDPWVSTSGVNRLDETPNGFLYTLTSTDARWQFDAAGILQTITQRNGWTLTLSRTAGVLTSVTNAFGRSLQFGYDTQARLSTIRTPDGNTLGYIYDGLNRLSSARYPDGSAKTYLYENSAFPQALTGINDETGQRFAIFIYDANGRAIGTSHDGGAQNYTFDYGIADTTDGRLAALNSLDSSVFRSTVRVTDPLGSVGTWQYQGGDGTVRLLSASGAFEGGQVASRNFALGLNLPTSQTDFLGTQTTFAWDMTRQFLLTTTRAANKPEALTTNTQWHPTLALQTVVAEPGRRTTSVYNGQPDPFNGGGIAKCGPALPDGSPIAVLCKQVQQATTDANGSAGLNAPLQVGVPARIWTWLYDQNSQMLLAVDPQGHSTRRTYYSDTTSTHAKGDLQDMTNAMGHVTRYTQYNGAGNLLQSIDPNGIPSNFSYDARQRLTSANIGGQITSYSYTPTGQLSRVTQPDGSFVSYRYDAAQRLTDLIDNLGNSIHYTLDNAGNRITEQVRDPAGALGRLLNRTIDALGNTQQITGLN